MKGKWAFSILLALLLLSIVACRGAEMTCKRSTDFASSADGGIISIAWDSNAEPKLGGYRVFYGTSPGKYKNCVDVGKATESSPGVVKYTLTGLIKGKRYYLAVIAYPAYDSPMNTSGFSSEVSAVAE